MMSDVVQRLVRNSACKGCVAGDRDNVFFAASLVACNRHAERCGKGCSCVAGPVAVVRALGAKHKTVQSARSSYRVEPLLPASEHLMYVSLMAHVEQQTVGGSVENVMQ